MPPEMARYGLIMAAWIVVVAGVLILFLDRQSAEFFITAFCLVVGLLFGIFVFLFMRRSMK